MTPAQILAYTEEKKRLWDKVFDGFIAQVDQIAARHKASCGVHTQGQLPSPSASVTSLSSDTSDRPLTGALGSGKAAPPAGMICTAEHKPTIPELPGYVGEDGGWIGPEYTAEELAEAPWSDSLTAQQLQESRGKIK